MSLSESELIVNPDGSIYHLHLKPGEIAETIITVGAPERVNAVAKYFDTVEFEAQHREFHTRTGTYKGKRFTVISTGIGTDNIDIAMNELDALVNIDFDTRTIRKEHTQLTILRIGTSGAIQAAIPLGSFLVTEKAIGFDNLLHFYGNSDFTDEAFSEALVTHLRWNPKLSVPYVVSADEDLQKLFNSGGFRMGITVTNSGFYGPQGRKLRLALEDEQLNLKLREFRYQGKSVDNMEMESSAIYGLSRLLGHKALSLNAIIANRANGTFSENPKASVDQLIKKTLDLLVI